MDGGYHSRMSKLVFFLVGLRVHPDTKKQPPWKTSMQTALRGVKLFMILQIQAPPFQTFHHVNDILLKRTST